jgi:hypothetical protein
MPIPKPKQNEDSQKFVARCMGNEIMKKDYPDQKQRVALCLGQTRKNTKGNLLNQVLNILGFSLSFNDCEECGDVEEVSLSNIVPPNDEDYVDFGEETQELFLPSIATYEYMDPVTYEKYYFERRGNYKKDGRYLRYEGEAKAAEYQGRKVTLNKPFRTSNGPKKFAVYVKNESGKVVIVRFGDPNMEIKKDIPARRKSFRARMRCDSPGPKWKARYWACKSW